MKLKFSMIKNGDIFEKDFFSLNENNGTIQFKQMGASGGLAVIYAPNGTGKSSLTNLLSISASSKLQSFEAADDKGSVITPETGAFHTIHDQNNRNVIHGKETDYLIGKQIRREYELRDRINDTFKNAFDSLVKTYKNAYKVSKVTDYLLIQIDKDDTLKDKRGYNYLRDIVNVRSHGKEIDQNDYISY